MPAVVPYLTYLVAAALFIVGLKKMARPKTAVRGNQLSATGMLMAIVVTVLDQGIVDYKVLAAGIILGSIIGAVLALKVKMTAMPEMVALLNGFGGAASVFVAGAALIEANFRAQTGTAATAGEGLAAVPGIAYQVLAATALSGLIGAVTFWGSLIAFAKLREYKAFRKPFAYTGQQAINAVLFAAGLALGGYVILNPDATWAYWALVGVGSILGLGLVNPIGGADMPVVVALLNSYSGMAAAATGFVLNNTILIIAGSLVGASGLILTKIMCKAMNRSLVNVLFGTLAPTESTPKADDVYAGKVKSASPEEVAMLFDTARRVMIVPGYGMAVAQAQHAVRDLADLLEERGTRVEFAIHPVAGRMPGHMNVLLAEADVSYEKMKEMDDANSGMEQVDVAMVIGANDVVNPVARTDPRSPIAGMPIIDVDRARTVVIIKRSLSPGFAGIPNPLFAADNALMLFADAEKAVQDVLAALKE